MSKSRISTWVALPLVGIGLLIAFLLGLNAYMHLTATPLHPDPAQAPSVTHFSPSRDWTGPTESARQIARASLSEQNLPGLSIAVGVGGELVWAEGFGFADLENRAPVTPGSRFRIGTASKVLTSAGIGLLLERNRLNLDDEIQTSVPEFPKKEWPVTLRHLMSHTAGVRTDGGDEGPYAEHCERPLESLRIFADRSLLFQPGTEYRYSSYGWMLLSAAVEGAAGEPFLGFMHRQVFEPLGMTDTAADSLRDPLPDQAKSYFPRYAADPKLGLHDMRDIDYSCYAGASVFVSTPSDLVRFGMGINGGKLLKPATVESLQTSQRLPSGEETGYGLGWDLEPATLAGEQTRVIGHDGESLGGMVASLMAFPDQGIVVAVTSNISYADTFAIGLKIAEAFAKKGSTPREK
jgi:serine beta-lactamase-like protein LACTB